MKSTFGQRLKRTIAESPYSIRSFAKELGERNVRGASRQMIHEYLKDKRRPSLEFVRGVVALLGDVREEWLVDGTDEMRRAGQKLADQSGTSTSFDQFDDLVSKVFPSFLKADFGVRFVVRDLWLGDLDRLATFEETTLDEMLESDIARHMAYRFAEALVAPLNTLDLASKASTADSYTLNSYILGMVQALKSMIDAPLPFGSALVDVLDELKGADEEGGDE